MTAQPMVPDGEQFTDAYHLTLTGVDDDVVREELQRLCQYETSDGLTYRISHAELMRLQVALARRVGEDGPHPDGPLWTERKVYSHNPTDAHGYFDQTTDDI